MLEISFSYFGKTFLSEFEETFNSSALALQNFFLHLAICFLSTLYEQGKKHFFTCWPVLCSARMHEFLLPQAWTQTCLKKMKMKKKPLCALIRQLTFLKGMGCLANHPSSSLSSQFLLEQKWNELIIILSPASSVTAVSTATMSSNASHSWVSAFLCIGAEREKYACHIFLLLSPSSVFSLFFCSLRKMEETS